MASSIALVAFIAAGLGILDTATHGTIVTDLGFRRDYSGVEGSENILIAGASSAFQGYVRASGGISNALVFGYLMAAIAVFATWMLEQTVIRSGWATRGAFVYLALGVVAGVACIESLTRGAIGALVVGLLLLVVLRRSRPILVGSVATVVLAFSLAWLGSGFIPPQAAGSPPAPTLIDIVGSRVTSSDTTSQVSSTMRLDQVRAGLASLAARPIGNGLGTEGSASTRIGEGERNLAPDVYLLEVALQTGVVGIILYATIFAAILLWTVRASSHGRALVLAMVAIFGIASVLSASPDAPVFATTIWLLDARRQRGARARRSVAGWSSDHEELTGEPFVRATPRHTLGQAPIRPSRPNGGAPQRSATQPPRRSIHSASRRVKNLRWVESKIPCAS